MPLETIEYLLNTENGIKCDLLCDYHEQQEQHYTIINHKLGMTELLMLSFSFLLTK